MLDIMFALDGITNIVECFEVNQPFQPVSLGEPIDKSRAMLKHPTDEIVGHPDIEDTIGSIGQKINVPTCHAEILQDVDGRDKPGHDELIELS